MSTDSSKPLYNRPVPSGLAVHLADETVYLLAERAIFWPRGVTLFITDPHFGKPSSFHAAGIPIPPAVTSRDLERLSLALFATHADHLVVLGDFRTRHSQEAPVLASLLAWRKRHPDLRITLVLGNHDRHAGEPPPELRIDCRPEPFPLPPFVCRHLPLDPGTGEYKADAPASAGYSLAGHLHPMITLRDRDGSQARLPCFLIGPQQTLLPAFGSFTGGVTITPTRQDLVCVVADDLVLELPAFR